MTDEVLRVVWLQEYNYFFLWTPEYICSQPVLTASALARYDAVDAIFQTSTLEWKCGVIGRMVFLLLLCNLYGHTSAPTVYYSCVLSMTWGNLWPNPQSASATYALHHCSIERLARTMKLRRDASQM